MTEIDISDLEDSRGRSRFQFDLKKVRASFQGQEIHLPELRLILVSRVQEGQPSPEGLLLIAEIASESIPSLKPQFAALAAAENGYLTYTFQMKPEVFSALKKAYASAHRPEEIVQADQYACLKLENYLCLGYGELKGKSRQEKLYPEARGS
ncbi:hypothetical protein COW36_12565 [bacterium (Candidatus Blackallbacteria) CG17_big_fil_post_rev_8_21_14_2_50_48_46]|uniref:Uncharacterized protein n=1 Tax=bacterium (Candidatus Blackallbacteria) CG17_big_fil_post_rev_8_21_14_2_50_48_46 TaxID=2014261 RepID=A0A2M7G4Y0_9BACT|nr:MAG: hypothetical protein COW64_02695 [bacterium (Candidatus Blackallbacteria) CG18_big_fil_WC_8_21_14_2_50_49_26]PIW16594.1 MAG: hypothetical protein COW36_12565 [bacterium (Candidatus Blackallbacteria) CG17_big_fil_post_rev_8_21_14_2_50_48_46]PIW46102.1 MAG: hypothetical protein COW20_17830 [bacterium (Candidatus Blackallbacteria) CG13_big_fil_rev_8_21_14_2_50_49_14]